MNFTLKRIDGNEDFFTKLVFNSYDEAYDLLEKNFGQACCSDTDYDQNNYYYIVKKTII